MFKSKTLFILGAGSSHEVGLPVGDTLKTDIAEKIDIRFDTFGQRQIHGDYQIMQALYEHTKLSNGLQGDPNPYLKSAHSLREALPQAISIDNLLDAHRGDKKAEICGKLAIVKCILESEQNSKLHVGSDTRSKIDFAKVADTWFAGFMRILTERVSRNEIETIFENVSFINFNYDRCVEHYLFNAIQGYYSISSAEAQKALSTLKVLHPYGSIGRLPCQSSDLMEVPFGSDQNNLLTLSKQIKTFNEQLHDKKEIEELRTTVQEAEVIVFLGFAFHRQNLELIAPESEAKAKRVYATAHGISMSDREVVINEIEVFLRKETDGVKIEIRPDLKCAGLFREYWRSLTSG